MTPEKKTLVPLPDSFKIVFEHAGGERTLNKHSTVAVAYRAGQLPEAAALLKPWYLRLKTVSPDGQPPKERPFKLKQLARAKAIIEARDLLNSMAQKPNEFTQFLATREARRGVTLHQLAADWFAAGLPFSRTKARSPEAAEPLKANTDRALEYPDWPAVPVIDAGAMDGFVVWRRANTNVKRGTGNRSADLQLAALSCLCQWAVFAGKLDANPFAVRERYQDPEDIRHCHEVMPENDEQLHALLTWLWTAQFDQKAVGNRYSVAELALRARLAGGWLAFTALVGLRPEEPQEIFRVPALDKTPTHPDRLLPGTVFPTRDGQLKMKIVRYKRGQNPFVTLHPAARDFLAAWNAWLDVTFAEPFAQLEAPAVARLFPSPHDLTRPLCIGSETSVLNDQLAAACAGCKVTHHITPKGFGRAVYVRVRRSQGADDATIAGELGQTTNGKLIRTTYGNPGDMIGGLLFDWVAEDGDGQIQPHAWQQLRAATLPANVIPMVGT